MTWVGMGQKFIVVVKEKYYKRVRRSCKGLLNKNRKSTKDRLKVDRLRVWKRTEILDVTYQEEVQDCVSV